MSRFRILITGANETNEARNGRVSFVPSIEVLERLAKALEVTSSDLVQKTYYCIIYKISI